MNQYKKKMRFMSDKETFALDTMDRHQLLQAAEQILQQGGGDVRYVQRARGIVEDAQGNRNFYVTLPMRRTLMGFIRPVFEAEWAKRNGKTAVESQAVSVTKRLNSGDSRGNRVLTLN